MAGLAGASVQNQARIEGAPFLRIPPFPGCRVGGFIRASAHAGAVEDTPASELAELIRSWRVGGTYWGPQPQLPSRYVLVRAAAPLETCERLVSGCTTVPWGAEHPACDTRAVISGDCDPWHVLGGAAALVAEAGDEVGIIAALLGVPTYVYDPATGRAELQLADAPSLLREVLSSGPYENPFGGDAINVAEAIALCGFWRRLIDSNRGLAGGVGFAFWKQDNVTPLLWSGSEGFPFLRAAPSTRSPGRLAIWRSRASSETISALEQSGVPLVEVEDGFLRSQGLGADCVPPLSITVDRLGAYFDPAQPSELELLLQEGRFDQELVTRARRLRQIIVAAGLGKYGRGETILERPAGGRRHILVPGQVEDDRSVQTGGCGITTNLDLLIRVRERAPDAYILYKPHPDVIAGHRKGAIQGRVCLEYADRIVSELPISSLIALVDEVHVNTSLAGFEALMREKEVTTYGVPFYAGWGLTCDLGPVPARRTARRTVDELVAATLLVYPRYVDPVTGLPCPVEIVIERLSTGQASETGLVVKLRRAQGKVMRHLRSFAQ